MRFQHKFLMLLFGSLCGASELSAQTDWRDLQNGFQTPNKNYADQPYFVVLEDGRWLLTVTTGPGEEGSDGQHVVSTTSADKGQTWTNLVDIEASGSELPAPDTNILSSWVAPCQSGYRAPGASYNRVYAIYTWGDPYVTSPAVPRRDTHGPFAFRYTDDGGTTWSARHIIPYTHTNKDRFNIFSGVTPAGWNVDKPLRLNGKMYFAFTKLSAPFSAPGGVQEGEGYIYRCDNIDTEGDPTALDWKMLPGTVKPNNSVDTAAVGIRDPAWAGEQEEFDLQDLSSGALLLTYRTTKGWIGESISTDEGQTWSAPVQRRFHPNGRVVRHPRANCKVWPLNSGKYLMWHHHNGGTDFGRRNPVFVSIGTRAGNSINWGEPEVLLYHRDKTKRISYPDMMEVGGTMYVSETEKGVSRVHPIDAGFLAILDTQPSRSSKTTAGLKLEQTGSLSGSYSMPTLPDLTGYAPKGFTIETRFQTSNLNAGQTVFDTFSGGRGVRMTVNTLGAVDFTMSDGTRSVTLRSDTGTVVAGQPAHISVHIDAPAKLITIVADGRVGDGTNHNTGGSDRIFGWVHFQDAFTSVNGGNIVVGSGLAGAVDLLRVYDRTLMHTEAVANWRHAAGISGPAVSAGIIPSDSMAEPGESITFDASHSDVSELTAPVYTWDFGDGSPPVQGAVVDHSFAVAGIYPVTMTVSEEGTPSLQGHPVATLNFRVQPASAVAFITAVRPPGSNTVNFFGKLSTLTKLPDPVYTWDFGDGNTDTGISLEHTYASSGDYTVTLTISRAGGGEVGGSPVATRLVNAGGTTPVGEILSMAHNGTAGDEGKPFDTLILDGGANWKYTTDGERSIMTAIDNATSGNNRLILVQADNISQFTDTGTAADKGWVFELEMEILRGDGILSQGSRAFACFGVRSENGAGKQAWIGLHDDGGADDKGRIGFLDSNGLLTTNSASLDVDGLIGNGKYHHFRIHKYDQGGTTSVDVFMDGALVLSAPYASLLEDAAVADIQGFASSTPIPLCEVNIDFINFTLYDNLIDSAPLDETAPLLESTTPADGASNVAPATQLVATFNEWIVLGTSGDVIIRNLTTPSDTIIEADGVDTDGWTTVNAVATPNAPTPNVTTVEATITGPEPTRLFLRAVAATPQ
jgi:PKD repeat protein